MKKHVSIRLVAAALFISIGTSMGAEPDVAARAAKKRAAVEEFSEKGYGGVESNLLAEAKIMDAGINLQRILEDNEVSENERRLLQRIVALNDEMTKQDGFAKTCDEKVRRLERQIADEEISAAEAAEKMTALTKEAEEIIAKKIDARDKRKVSIRQINGELSN